MYLDEEYSLYVATGDSMIGEGINNGDIIIVKHQGFEKDGEILAVEVSGRDVPLTRRG